MTSSSAPGAGGAPHRRLHALGFIRRALAIAGFFLFHGLRFVLGWVARLALGRPRAERQAWFAACVLALFRSLGATFIKVGQILSTRPDLLPPHLVHALEKLQDDVGPFSFERVRATLLGELGQPPERLFAEIDPAPIASASVAQVHRARLPDGRLVAVKVRRPAIEELVDFDLAVVRLFARVLELAPSLKLLAPVESVEEFGRGIRMQLDFTIEAANNRRFRENFAGDAEVIFPPLVDELCTRQVLVMQFIDGVKILRWREIAGVDPKRLARIGFRVLLKMVFEDGFVHADLHPGNILVSREGAVAIVDLGLVGELDGMHKAAFARYFAAWAQRDGRTMARLMARLSPSRTIPDYAAFEADIDAFVHRYHGRRLGEVGAAEVFFDMMGIVRRHRVRAVPEFTLVNIAIAVTEGIGKQLDPDIDLVAAALPFFARLDFSDLDEKVGA
jgi:ubiquinone biosynthesis protein